MFRSKPKLKKNTLKLALVLTLILKRSKFKINFKNLRTKLVVKTLLIRLMLYNFLALLAPRGAGLVPANFSREPNGGGLVKIK